MSVVKCPKCGGTHCILTDNKKKHGFLWFILIGWIYLFILFFKWMIGLFILTCFDWWIAIIKKHKGVGYIWKSKRFFSNSKKSYYCNDCGNNFRG